MAEIYFADRAQLSAYLESRPTDRLEEWSDPARTLFLTARTEMVGIP